MRPHLKQAFSVVILLMAFTIPQLCSAQTLAPAACQQFFSASGIPLAGGFLYSFTAGTSTPTPTYADSAATIPNSNPLILNSGGFPVSATGGCGIWLATGTAYKFVVQNSTHTAQWTVDNIANSNLTSFANTWSMLQTFSAGITGTGTIGTLGLGTTALAASNTWTGPETFSGSFTASNPCSFDGQIFVSSSGCYTTLATAFAACSGNPCIIDMRGASSATTLGTFDPGTSFPVTILLGPFNYNLAQLTIRTGLNFIGMGHGATTITQATAGTAPFTMVGSGQAYPNNVVNGATIKGFTLLPSGSSTTDAFNLTAHAATSGSCSTCGGGLEYSTFDDVTVGSGFGGSPFKFVTLGDGTPVSLHQFNYFRNVVAFRATNGVPTFWFTGQGGQFSFENCEFDGNVVTKDTSANMYNIRIDDGALSGFVGPYSFHFKQTTSQGAWGASGAAIYLSGAEQITCEVCHFENDNGVIKEVTSSSGRGNWAIVIDNPLMGTSTAINSGNGFISSTDATSSLDIRNSAFNGTPDQIFIGTSTKYVSSSKNFNFVGGGLQPWSTEASWIVSDSGTCTMTSGACGAQNLTHAYVSGKLFCTASWNGTGTFTGIMSAVVTVSGGTGGVATVNPTSSVGTDTAHVWWICVGQAQ